MTSPRKGVVLLILANLVPLVGVLAYEWDVFVTLALYWAENGIIGLFNIFKIGGVARGQAGLPPSFHLLLKGFTILLFLAFFGGFWAAHGVVVAALFTPDLLDAYFISGTVTWSDVTRAFDGLEATFGMGLLSLFLSHTVSFFSDFLGKQEYLHMTPRQQFAQPFERVFVLQVTVVVGGLLVDTVGAPVLALIVLVLAKSYLDLKGYHKERRRAQSEQEAGSPASADVRPPDPLDPDTLAG